MKTKVTKKQILNSYSNVISVPYCAVQNLMLCRSENFYTSSVCGWGADIYEIDANTVIVTGYMPFGKKANIDITKKYDDKARIAFRDSNLSYESKVKILNNLVTNFVSKCFTL